MKRIMFSKNPALQRFNKSCSELMQENTVSAFTVDPFICGVIMSMQVLDCKLDHSEVTTNITEVMASTYFYGLQHIVLILY